MYSGKTVQRVNNKNTLKNLPHPRVPHINPSDHGPVNLFLSIVVISQFLIKRLHLSLEGLLHILCTSSRIISAWEKSSSTVMVVLSPSATRALWAVDKRELYVEASSQFAVYAVRMKSEIYSKRIGWKLDSDSLISSNTAFFKGWTVEDRVHIHTLVSSIFVDSMAICQSPPHTAPNEQVHQGCREHPVSGKSE